MNSTASAEGGKLYGVQVARALAALSVLTGHSLHEAALVYQQPTGFSFPWISGVDLFFVVSGFIIVFTSQNLFQSPGGLAKFLKRRLTRIVPLYWFYTFLMVVAILLFREKIHTATFNTTQIIDSFLFFPGFARPGGQISPTLGLGWTLDYEVFFYICFAFLIFLRRTHAVAVLLVGFTAFALTSLWVPYTWTPLRFWTSPIILEFVAGAVLASFYIDGFRIRKTAAAVLFVASVIALGVQPFLAFNLDRAFAFGAPAVGIFLALGMVRDESDGGRWPMALVKLGDLSFSLYLSHPFTLAILAMAWEASGATQMVSSWGYCVVAVAMSILGSYVSFVIIERPLMRLFKRDRVAVPT